MRNLERITLWLVIGIPAAILVLYGGALRGFPESGEPVSGPKALDSNRHLLVLNGNKNQDAVTFNHEDHRKRLGQEAGCVNCHHLYKPRNLNSACFDCHADMKKPTAIFSHSRHEAKLGENNSCRECHDLSRVKSRENARACQECHREDMGMTSVADNDRFNFMAPGYENAMHQLCLTCHEQQAKTVGRPELPGCDTCHLKVHHEPDELTR